MIRIFILISVFLILTGCTSKSENRQIDTARYSTVSLPMQEKARTPRFSKLSDGLLLSWVDVSAKNTKLKYSVFKNGYWSKPKMAQQGDNWLVNYADYASVQVIDDHHFVAVWLEHTSNLGEDYRFMVSQSFDGGDSWGAPSTPISDSLKGAHGFVSVQPDKNDLIFTWISEVGDDAYALMSSHLNRFEQWAATTRVDDLICSCCHPDSIRWNDRIYVVYRNRTVKEVRDIAIASYVENTWTQQGVLENDNWEINGCPVNGPSISATEKGYAVTWFTLIEDSPVVKIKTFDIDSGETQLYEQKEDSIGYADSLSLGANSVLVMWLSNNGEPQINLKKIVIGSQNLDGKDIKINQGRVTGFPSLAEFEGQIFIAYESRDRHINAISLSMDNLSAQQ